MTARILFALGLVALGAGCSASTAEDTTDNAAALATNDVADTSCRLVLRNAASKEGTQGASVGMENFQFVWTLEVDVSNEMVAQGGTVGVHYQHWENWEDTSRALRPVDGALAGYQRFYLEFISGTPQSSSIANRSANFIPYVQLPTGERFFDHNRESGNYWLTSENRWSLGDDPNRCH